MKKYVLPLSLGLSLGSYATSMERKTIEEFNEMLRQQNDHGHEANADECEHRCTGKKNKVLKQIQSMRNQMSKNMINKTEGNKKIQEIKNHWNNEHPNDQF
jgi:hypothetical protein